MSLISVIVIIVLIGVIMWAVNKYVPMAPNIKTLLNVAVVIILIIWLLPLVGGLTYLNEIRVGG